MLSLLESDTDIKTSEGSMIDYDPMDVCLVDIDMLGGVYGGKSELEGEYSQDEYSIQPMLADEVVDVSLSVPEPCSKRRRASETLVELVLMKCSQDQPHWDLKFTSKTLARELEPAFWDWCSIDALSI